MSTSSIHLKLETLEGYRNQLKGNKPKIKKKRR